MAQNNITSIRFFNRDLVLLGELRSYTSLIFNRQWTTFHDFEIHTTDKRKLPLFKSAEYIMINDDPYRSGIIRYDDDDTEGYRAKSLKDITIKGFGLLYKLYGRFTEPPADHDGYYTWTNTPVEDIMFDLVRLTATAPTKAAKKMPKLTLGVNQHRGPRVTFQSRLKRVTAELYDLSVMSGLGCTIKLDADNQVLVFEVLSGIDRVYSPINDNSYTFLQSNRSVITRAYTRNRIGTANVGIVAGQGDGADREIITINDEITGDDRWETYIDARDVDQTEDSDNTALIDRGRTKLAGMADREHFDFKVSTADYGDLWDLGDYCSFYDRETDRMLSDQVTAVKEVWEGGVYQVDPVFGYNIDGFSQSIVTANIAAGNERAGVSTKFKQVFAEYAELQTAVIGKADIKDLTALNARVVTLDADMVKANQAILERATIAELNAVTGRIGTLETDLTKANQAIIGKADIGEFNAVAGRVGTLETDLTKANQAIIGKADIGELNAVAARLGTAEIGVANINTLLAGNTVSGSTQTIVLNAQNTTLDQAFIKSGIAAKMAVDDLQAGKISTDKFTVGSDDGRISMAGSTLQVKDATRVRIQIGKDGTGDYSVSVYDASGNLMWDARGAKAAAIKDKIIVNDMVSETAGITGNKLNIPSVVTQINAGTTLIKSNLVSYDPDGQTLDVVFSRLKTTMDGAVEDVQSNTTAISVANGKISTLITDVAQTSGDLSTLTSRYNQTVTTVDGMQTTIGALQTTVAKKADGTTVTALDSKVSSLTTDLTGFKSTVASTYETKTTVAGIKTTADNALSAAGTAQATANGAIKGVLVQYAQNTSALTAPTTGWSETAPAWVDGKYIWQRTVTTTSVGTSTSAATCLSGAKGATGQTGATGGQGIQGPKGADGVAVASVDVQYAKSASATTAPTTGWQTTAPVWESGKYIWQRSVTVYSSGASDTSNAVCITGEKGSTGSAGQTGATGAQGIGVKAIAEQYYLSTSSTTQSGGSWLATSPAYVKGRYYWTRSAITWTDNTTTYTTPVLSSGINAAASTADAAKDQADANADSITSVTTRTSMLENTTAGLTNKVASVEQTLTTKADGSTVTTLNSKVNTLTNTVDGLSSNVSSLQTTVDTKADGSALITTNNKVATLESNVNGITSRVTATETVANAAKTNAETAQTAANAAQSTANTAKTNAATAQSTANTAKSTADTATTNLSALTTRVSTAEQKITPTAITATISSALSGNDAIATTKFVMDKNGFLIKNGGLSIQNNAGVTVLSADVAGNLSMTGNLKLLGAQSMAICDNEAVEIGKVYFGINRRQGYDYKCTQILAHQALELHAGDINKPADTNQFGACYARGSAMIGWGYDKTTGRRWATLGASDDSSPLLGGVTVDTGSSPQVSAAECTIVSTSFSMAPGFVKGSDQNQVIKNALGNFCTLTFSVNGQVNASTHTRIFTLPSGYRPVSSIFIPGVGGVYGWFQIRIDPNGDVIVWHPSGMTSMRGNAVFYI